MPHELPPLKTPNVLIVGCGDIGSRLGADLLAQGWQVGGLRRRADALPAGFIPLAADLGERDSVAAALQTPWHTVAFMPAAEAFSEAAYQRTYVDGMRHVIEAMRAWRPRPARVFMLSSASVYGQADGSWVDEDSPTQPTHFAGQLMRAAECCLHDSGLAHCIVRSAGIYGPGREGMIQRLLDGQCSEHGDAQYRNRIHSDDLAGFLAYLLHWTARHAPLRECYLVCDDRPAPLQETEGWLAAELGLDYAALTPHPARRRGGKRCRNRLMHDSGYRLRYPDYRAGYRALLDERAGDTR